MTKKLEDVFNLPQIETDIEENVDTDNYSDDDIKALMDQADKIDAALPVVSGLDGLDSDYDEYARKAVTAFDDLIDLAKNVEDRHVGDIAQAASTMLGNALNAKNNKAKKKLEMIRLQVQKARLEHDKEKLDYLRQRHLNTEPEDTVETDGRIVATRDDLIRTLLAEMKNDNET